MYLYYDHMYLYENHLRLLKCREGEQQAGESPVRFPWISLTVRDLEIDQSNHKDAVTLLQSFISRKTIDKE